MSKFRVYKFITYNRLKIIKALFLLLLVLLASVPVIILVNLLLPQGISTSFLLEYDSADEDFTSIDYSGIQYYLDGQLFITSSNTISLFINDYDEHKIPNTSFGRCNLTIYFGGETYEYLFNSDITETITLVTKSINSTAYWSEIIVIIEETFKNENTYLDLLWFDGTNWIVVETSGEIVNGLVEFDNLIMGNYMIAESGKIDGIEFTIDQSMNIYTDDIFVTPVKTFIDIDYLNTLLGNDYPVDLSTLIWELGRLHESTWLSMGEISYDAVIVSNGLITIYNLQNAIQWSLRIENYAGVTVDYGIITEGTTEIDLVAKSLEATFEWSDSSPVIDIGFELFYNGESLGIFTTDAFGIITITELLPCGEYYFEGQAVFNILADDTLVVANYVIEPMCVKKSFSLKSYRDIGFKYFSFFVFKIKLILNPELSVIGFFVFWKYSPTFSMHWLTAQFTSFRRCLNHEK